MASEILIGANGTTGNPPVVAMKTVRINSTTGAVVEPTTLQSGSEQVVLYDASGNPVIVTDYSADAVAVNRKSLLTVAQLEALNPAGTGDRLRANATRDLMVQQRHATAWVSATAAISTGVTLTIPAGAAGVFNYLCYLSIVLFAGAALTPAATPVLVTSTGMTGTPTWSFPNAGAQGVIAGEQKYEGHDPIIGSAAATAITVVCPVLTGGIWRVNATYFQA